MRDVIDEDGRVSKPAAIASSATGVLLAGVIVYNALLGQGLAPQFSTVAAGSAAPAADAGSTVQFKYDPVVEEVQRQLLAAGYYKGPVDGVTGKRTRAAIAAYQQAQQLKVDGEASAALAEHIRYTRQITEASLFTGDVTPVADAEQRAVVRRVQARLSDLSYDPGEISGVMSDGTRQAILRFQHDHHIAETGAVSVGLQQALDQAAARTSAALN